MGILVDGQCSMRGQLIQGFEVHPKFGSGIYFLRQSTSSGALVPCPH